MLGEAVSLCLYCIAMSDARNILGRALDRAVSLPLKPLPMESKLARPARARRGRSRKRKGMWLGPPAQEPLPWDRLGSGTAGPFPELPLSTLAWLPASFFLISHLGFV